MLFSKLCLQKSCGNSEGDHITLGHKESFDLESIVDYVKSFRFISKYATLSTFSFASDFRFEVEERKNKAVHVLILFRIAIWGRSMGAATTLLYVKNNPLAVQAICLDSPFSNLKKLIFGFI